MGRVDSAYGRSRVRPRVGRTVGGRPRKSRGGVVRIAILAPVWFAVPPSGYGGIEWVVSLLADALTDAGHDVTLFASGDSRTKAKLVSVFPQAPSRLIGRSQPELLHALTCYVRADEFEVLNDHTGLLGAVLGATVDTPVVHSLHGPLDGAPGRGYDV